MLLVGQDFLIGFPKVRKAMPSTKRHRDALPQLLTSNGAAISCHRRHDLPSLAAQSDPDPVFVGFEAQDQFASRGEGRNQPSPQDSAGFQGRPSRTVQDPMVVGEASFLARSPARAGQAVTVRFSGALERSDQQAFGVRPNWLGEQRRKLSNQGQQLGRQRQQLKTSRGKRGLQLTRSADTFSKIKNGQSRAKSKFFHKW